MKIWERRIKEKNYQQESGRIERIKWNKQNYDKDYMMIMMIMIIMIMIFMMKLNE